ncbi:flavoprotein [Halopolyspora algeriensis]|uniref:Flavoprotein n=1 Tax=Halopolyspora algeriensis TaxID=1500506 RepID=A0A368VWL6_9ACTN|nr:flavoprotein [Halopolyspora algeriensis]RCW45128.1 flavoprotein [Halopolyspora algeriensis]TQM53150.1 flavoprotein [Halopolyspora algeriensis]
MTGKPVVYLVACSAPPVRELAEPLSLLHEAGWSACVILTPIAASWIDIAGLEAETAVPVRVHPRLPHEQDPLPKADAVLAAPLTFNSLNKIAGGISDTLAVSLVNELLGTDLPIVAAPCIKSLLRTHPVYSTSVQLLTSCGVHLLDPDTITSRGLDGLAAFDWSTVVTEFLQAV